MPLRCTALCFCLALLATPATAAPLRLALHAEGPQDLLLDVAPDRPAVQYVPHGRPVAEPDTDNEADRALAQVIDADAPAMVLQALAPAPDGVLHDDDAVEQARLVDGADAASALEPPLTDAAISPAEAVEAAEAVSLPGQAAARTALTDEAEAELERRRAQRLAVQWTVVPLVMLSLGLWWLLGWRRPHSTKDLSSKPVQASRRGHRRARRATGARG